MKPLTLLISVSVLLSILFLRYFFFVHTAPVFQDGQVVTITTILLTEPTSKGKTQRFSIHPQGQRITVYTTQFPRFSYGESLRITGTINKRVLGNGWIALSISFPKIVRESENASPLVKIAKQLRENIVTLYKQTLPPTGAGLLSGIVLGVKGSLPEDFETSFGRVGLLHIIAASGMNVTIAGGALFFLSSYFLRRRTAIMLSFFGVLFYALMTGLESSIVRASLMAGIAGAASLLGRQQHAGISLFLTGYCLLLYNPALFGDIGFQLSMTATAGIIFIKPKLSLQRETKKGVKALFKEDLTTTLAAQIATLPILLGVFGEYGLLSVPVNLLILWTVPFLMAIGGISAVIGLVFTPIAKILLYLSMPFLLYIEAVVRFFGDFQLVFETESFSSIFTASYYLFLVAWVFGKKKHTK